MLSNLVLYQKRKFKCIYLLYFFCFTFLFFYCVEASAVGLEPTNQATNFTVTNKNTYIQLNWTDATGTQLPDGYIIMVNTTGTFTDPVDGTDITTDNDLSDGIGAIKVNQGVQAYSGWIKYKYPVTYYFKIYSYTNSGNLINYKTDGTVPQQSVLFLQPEPVYDANFFTGINNNGYIKLTWKPVGLVPYPDGFVIMANTTNVFTDPVDQIDVVNDNDLSDGTGIMKCVGYGNNEYSGWINYNTDVQYYFKIYVFVGSGTGINYRTNGTPPVVTVTIPRKPEPTNHVTNFTATDYSGNVTLRWTDATGTQIPDAYLILVSKTNSFTDPVDGTNVADDLDLTDGKGSVNVSAGAQTFSYWIHNEINATYYFRIYPYTNFTVSSSRDYKTDDVPQISIAIPYYNFIEQYGFKLPALYNSSVAWGDYNNDGYKDLIITGRGVSKIYKNSNGTALAEQTNIILPGTTYGSVAWGDYNNDGYLDFILTGCSNSGSTPISKIYKNNSDGTFTEQTNIVLPGVQKGSVAWADYDNDGDLDLLLTGNNGTGRIAKIFRNNGDNTFTEQLDIVLQGVDNSSVAWGDYNNDGNQDILLTGFDGLNPVSKIYKNSGDNTFTEQTGLALTGITQGSVAWGDLNNDGYLDFVLSGVTSYDYLTSIYQNNGNNTFTKKYPFSSTPESSLALGDYNNDGYLDIFLSDCHIVDAEYQARIYKNTGNFNFESTVVFPYLREGSSEWGDIDNDGDLDLIVSGWNYSTGDFTKIYQNNFNPSTVTLPSTPDKPSSQSSVNGILLKWNRISSGAVADNTLSYNIRIGTTNTGEEIKASHSVDNVYHLTGMGNVQKDTFFLLKNTKWNTTCYASVQAVNNAFQAGAFSIPLTFTASPVQASGINSKVLSASSLLVEWKRGNGEQCVVFAKETSTDHAVPASATIYFDNPEFGKGSPIGTSGWYCVYKGLGDSVVVTGLNPSKNYSFQVIEMQGKSGQENYCTDVSIQNLAVFTTNLFIENKSITFSSTVQKVDWCDTDLDGDLDMVYTEQDSVKNYLYITKIKRNDNGVFTELTIAGIPKIELGNFALGDFNNDGYPDIFLIGLLNSDQYAKIFLNQHNNTFTLLAGTSFYGLYNMGHYNDYPSTDLGDFNNDGYLDILYTGYNSSDNGYYTKLYKNNGNNTFTETSLNVPSIMFGKVKWADLNNDGYLDFIITTESEYPAMHIYQNNGNETFTEKICNLPKVESGSIDVGDYDNDGFADIIVSSDDNILGTITRIYKNDGNFGFTHQTGFVLPQVKYSHVSWCDYNNDGYPDLYVSGEDYYGNLITKIYRNDLATNNTRTLTDSKIELPASGLTPIVWGDYDNDGDMDILFGNGKVYKNNLIMKNDIFYTNIRPAIPQNVTTVSKPNELIINWDKASSNTEPHVTYNVVLKNTTTGNWLNAPASSFTDGTLRLIASEGNAGGRNFAVFKNLIPGTYEAKVQAIDGAFYASPWSAPVTIEQKQVQAYFTFDEVCRGSETHFTDQSTPQGNLTWLWKFENGKTSIEQNPKHLFTTSGTHQVWLVITSTELKDANGNFLKDSVLHTINVKPNPKAAYTAPNVCQGTETIFTNSTDMDGTTAKSWKWDYGNGETSTGSVPLSKTYGVAKTYNTKLIVVATNDCADSAKVSTTVAPMPTAVISVTQNSKFSFCKDSDDSANLSLATQDNCNYQWENYSVVLIDKTNNQLAITGSDNVGTYSITATVTSNLVTNGCIAKSTNPVAITINPKASKPLIEEKTNNTLFCPGTEVELNVKNYSNTINYQWKFYGVAIDRATNQAYKGKLAAGDYSVEAEPGSCATESDKITLTTKPAPPKPNIYAKGPNVWILACDNASASDYRWYYNDQVVVGAKSYQYVANQNLGNYYVEISDGGECYTMSDIINIPTGNITSGIDDLVDDAVVVFPNPTDGKINVALGLVVPGETNVQLIDALGNTNTSYKYQNTSGFSVDLSGYPKGFYYCKISNENSVVVKKIVKQ